MAHIRSYTADDGCHRWQYWGMGRYATLASQDYAQEIQVWHTFNKHYADCFGGLSAYNHIMTAPSIESSTREERLDYVLNEWRCLHNCELCGKCHILKGRSEESLYADYIDGKRSYMDITLEIRNNR